MIHTLKSIAFYGGVLIAFLGLVLILIENDTGESPQALVTFMRWIVFISGLSIVIVIVKGGLKN